MTMPAGTYYVGDLCYVMGPEWDEFCDLTIQGQRCIDGEMTLKDGSRFATYATLYGDGEYVDNFGNKYGVDAGLIGCILVSDISHDGCIGLKDGHVHTFDRPFETGSTNGGVIIIGHIRIDTN